MEALATKIYEQALDLPIEERLLLIDKLLQSANLPTREEIDKAWANEVEQRSKAVESGREKMIPGEEVLEKVKKRFYQ